MRRACILFVVILSLITITTPSHSQDDDNAPRLYFQSDNTISLIDPNTDPPTLENLATFPSAIQCSKWADGDEWLIISTMTGIYRLNHDTLELETMVEESQFGEDVRIFANCPLVSPNGDWIGFRTSTPQRDASGTLYSMRVDGSDLQMIIPEFTFGADWRGLVEWSHDSEWMMVGVGIDNEWGSWHVRPDGSGLELIDDGIRAEHLATPSPDGHSAAYWTRNETPRTLRVNSTPIFSLDNINIVGESFAPVWTPDGHWLIVMITDWTNWTGDVPEGYLITLRIAPDGSEYETLSEIPYDLAIFTGILPPAPPDWSPNREWAVIVQSSELIDIGAGLPYTLPGRKEFAFERYFLWEADSQGLFYTAIDGDDQSLMQYDTLTHQSTFIIDLPNAENSWNHAIEWWDQP